MRGTPKEQQTLGRQIKDFDSHKWNENKKRIVCDGNYLKFTQAHATRQREDTASKPLKGLLLATGDRELIEASPEDRVWGIGFDAEHAPTTPRERWGLNLLGQILVDVREEIKCENEICKDTELA